MQPMLTTLNPYRNNRQANNRHAYWYNIAPHIPRYTTSDKLIILQASMWSHADTAWTIHAACMPFQTKCLLTSISSGSAAVMPNNKGCHPSSNFTTKCQKCCTVGVDLKN
ncbi:hypothetical protein ABBQ32_002236 [Trebouxia sp. C0010 RCD-2024]